MKIAITGGAGFIGTELARALQSEGHEVVLLDLVKSEALPQASQIASVTDPDALHGALTGVDVIYHLAAEHRDDVSPVQKYYDVNVGGAENLVKAAKAHNIQTIIFTSTVAVYGLDAGDPALGSQESDSPDPFNDYGKSKLQSEQVFEDWANEDQNRKLVTLRLVATFGPGNRGNIFTLMNQIACGKFIMIGSGKNNKSVAYVKNVAGFLNHCKTLEPGIHIYNYADKPDLTMKDMVADIRSSLGLDGLGPRAPYIVGLMGGMTFDVAAKLTGKTFPISAIRVKKFCANTIVSAEKLKETGYKAPYSLSDGLKDMIEAEFKNASPAENKKAA